MADTVKLMQNIRTYFVAELFQDYIDTCTQFIEVSIEDGFLAKTHDFVDTKYVMKQFDHMTEPILEVLLPLSSERLLVNRYRILTLINNIIDNTREKVVIETIIESSVELFNILKEAALELEYYEIIRQLEYISNDIKEMYN